MANRINTGGASASPNLFALFTGEDVLTTEDRRAVAVEADQDRKLRYRQALWRANIAYHTARARGASRSLAWLDHDEGKDIEESRHDAAVIVLVGIVAEFVRVPASTKTQLTEKANKLRKWSGGASGSMTGVACWRAHEVLWQAALEAEAERMGAAPKRAAK